MYVCDYCVQDAEHDEDLAREVQAILHADGDSAPEGECNVCGG